MTTTIEELITNPDTRALLTTEALERGEILLVALCLQEQMEMRGHLAEMDIQVVKTKNRVKDCRDLLQEISDKLTTINDTLIAFPGPP